MEKNHHKLFIASILLAVVIAVSFAIAHAHRERLEGPEKYDYSGRHSKDMHGMMSDMSAGLKNKTGDEFDKAFLDEMIAHHQGAIDMAELVLETSQRPELKAMAKDIIDAQTREINQMKQWRSEWFQMPHTLPATPTK